MCGSKGFGGRAVGAAMEGHSDFVTDVEKGASRCWRETLGVCCQMLGACLAYI